MALLLNLARVNTSSTTTGTVTLGSAVAPFLSFNDAGAVSGTTYSYSILDGSSASEIGTGTYTSAGGVGTFTRTPTKSTNSNLAITTSGAAQIMISPRAEDLPTLGGTNAYTGSNTFTTQTAQDNSTKAATTAYVDRGSSGASLVLLASSTTGGAATIDFTSGITSTYSEYVFVLSPIYSATDNTTLLMLLSDDAGSTWKSTGYDWAFMYVGSNSSTTPGTLVAENDSSISLIGSVANNVARPIAGEVKIFSPSDTTRHPIISDLSEWTTSGHFLRAAGGGIYQGGNVSINGVRFKMASGNIVGSIYMYGRRIA